MSIQHARVYKMVTPGDKYWAEFTVGRMASGGRVAIGVATPGVPINTPVTGLTRIGTLPAPSGETQVGVSPTCEEGDVLSIGADLSLGKVHFYKNGDLLGVQDVNAAYSYYLVGGVSKGCKISVNLFQHVPFQFPVLSGFTDWVGNPVGTPTSIDNQFLSGTV